MKILNKDLDDYVLGKATDKKKNVIDDALKSDDGILRDKIADINIIHFISNFLISKDIISLTDHWKKSWSNVSVKTIAESAVSGKGIKFYDKSYNYIIFAILTTLVLSFLAGWKLWKGNVEEIIVNETFAETINKNQIIENNVTPVPLYPDENDEVKIYEKPESTHKTKSAGNKYKQIAMTMLPSTKFERLRDDKKSTFGEDVYNFYMKGDLKSLLGIQNDFRKKGIANEYLEDLIGRLLMKRGETDKALLIYTELSQIDSPNVDEYEFLLLLCYYAALPDSEYNFTQLQKYISGDTLHTYFREVKRLKIN
ncbi:MAG: hypothetical protein IPM42_03445 [Saprospiraceae bacterium]|nr:hypothetical protein [Saprospiraceae bacterium]